MKRIIMYQRRARYRKLAKKKTIISLLTVMTVIVCALIIRMNFQGGQEKIYTKAEIVEDSSTKKELETIHNSGSENETTTKDESEKEEKVLDNSGYLLLEKDPNADDAIQLFHTTEKLIKKEINYPVRKDGKKVAYLTFDDGPSTTNTPKILDILKENGIKSTFFIMGKQVDSSNESKEILKRTVREGHAIANHTYGHDYKYLYPNRVININNFMSDVDKCNEALKNVLGKDFSTRTIRFPGGYWSWEGRSNARPVIVENGYAIVDWNTLSSDAEGKSNKNAEELTQITKQNLENLGPNADSVVLLMHDTYGKEETVKSLQPIINIFKEKGFEFRTMK